MSRRPTRAEPPGARPSRIGRVLRPTSRRATPAGPAGSRLPLGLGALARWAAPTDRDGSRRGAGERGRAAGRPPLPEGFGIVLDAAARRTDGGSTLIGGTPVTVLRLSAAGTAALDGLVAGSTVPPSGEVNRLARRLVDRGLAHPRPPAVVPGPEVTVVIPVRDDPAGLAATLASLGPAGPVLVVDDGSHDPAAVRRAVALRPRADAAQVLRLARSQGPAGARQAGWEAAATDVVAFVDAGCRPEPGWLAVLTGHLADPGVAAVAPRIQACAGPGTPAWLAAYERLRSPLDLGSAPAAVRPRSRVPYVPTAALVVRRAALVAVGGFDPGLRFGEDVDLVWRLAASGWVVRYEPAASVAHPARPDLGALLRQRFGYGSSAAPLAGRHGEAVAPLAVPVSSALVWLLAVWGHPLLGAGVAGATTAALAPRLRRLHHPWGQACRLAAGGHLRAGRLAAEACRRPWWPLLALACLGSRRARRLALVVAVVPPLLERRPPRSAVGLPAWLALRLADDLAYGLGAWAGALRARSAAALRPAVTTRPAPGPARAPTPEPAPGRRTGDDFRGPGPSNPVTTGVRRTARPGGAAWRR